MYNIHNRIVARPEQEYFPTTTVEIERKVPFVVLSLAEV